MGRDGASWWARRLLGRGRVLPHLPARVGVHSVGFGWRLTAADDCLSRGLCEHGFVSTSAARAAAFFREARTSQRVWAIRDQGGFPAPATGDGLRAMPFWSARSRAEKVIATVPAYSGTGRDRPVGLPRAVAAGAQERRTASRSELVRHRDCPTTCRRSRSSDAWRRRECGRSGCSSGAFYGHLDLAQWTVEPPTHVDGGGRAAAVATSSLSLSERTSVRQATTRTVAVRASSDRCRPASGRVQFVCASHEHDAGEHAL
ncbi:uncharacterized protein DUF2750 [Kribbella orskensis]|uniref:Uncharacterized protein DUF2750 n=1 Tax=Kribbella orskensis TaxID=2512216 RepID=A0ABY2B5S0_9ACTN|nr:uncharacterized protein DUF2750 [Kribbella sp. VKM Ac-2500]TCO07587.1 uncharacterized protein DUF2750 [Kribbella orskensis]